MPSPSRICTAPGPDRDWAFDVLRLVAALAAKLGSTVPSVRSGYQRGFIPRGTKIPGLGLRWDEAAIDAWLSEQLSKKGAA